jgi:dihydroxy-acid dehydratase
MAKKKEPKGIDKNLTQYGDREFSRYLRRAFLSSAGYDADDLDRPIVGIVDTSSDYNTCHRQMPEMVAAIKRGVLEAGGLPLAFPTISLNEIFTAPTTMFYRNLAALETEEMIKAQPMDAVVLLSGCDKTLPAQVMAAISADVPAIFVVSGPMMTGRFRGERLGACTDCRRFWARYRSGELSAEEIREVEKNLVFTGGTCMVMGTATTMACVVEAMGLMLPGGAVCPHASGDRLKQCVASGRRAVFLATHGVRPGNILGQESFENAVTVLSALSGSTNAVVHLLAIARRAGVALSLGDFDRIARNVPLLVDTKPAGSGYAEDLYHAGGVPVLLRALKPLLRPSAKTVAGTTIGELIRRASPPQDWQTTIRTLDDPLGEPGALAVVSGSLAPNGAVIKAAAASPSLKKHRGPAFVFDSLEDVARKIDDRRNKLTPDHVLVLRDAGPVGAGMPEAGSLPIPAYLARQGVTDMVRISDARMSGTAYGTVVLHVSPESAVGGPLSLVRNGDQIELDVSRRRIDLLVDVGELDRRRKKLKPPRIPERGWARLFAEHVLQAHEGADLDFL